MKASPFLAIAILELVHTVTATQLHRLPSGHDGFQYFTIQYYFLNNAIQAREVAQWIPYMNQGTVATLWYGIQGSFLQNVLLYAAPWLRSADLLTAYHVGMFVDEMILLTGVWLLAGRFFRMPSVLFISVSIVGSCVWLDQPYWNFRLYYAIPLVLELGHRFLDSGRWRWLFLGANLLALQTVGNLPYLIPVVSFVVFAYFASYAAANLPPVCERLRALPWGWPAMLAIALGALSFWAPYKYLAAGTDQLVSYNPSRYEDGSIDLTGFLTYGGLTDFHKWIDLLLNLSPWLDMTVYAGILLAPLLLCGLLTVDPRRLHFVVLAVTMLLFTLATDVSVVLFEVWPGMKYFRHIGLVSPLVKVLFCFVAGIGFEWLFEQHPARRRWVVCGAAAGALMLVGAAWLALDLSRARSEISEYVDALSDPSFDRPLHTYQPAVLARRLRSSAMLALGGAAVVGMIPVLLGLRRFSSSARLRVAMLGVALIFVTADVYQFKFRYLFDRSDGIPPDLAFLTRSAAMSYSRRRLPDLHQAVPSSPRLQATLHLNQTLLHSQARVGRGTQYWSNNAFFFTDEAGSSFRVDSWLKPLDQFMRMIWRVSIHDRSTLPAWVSREHLEFPSNHIAAAKASGLSEDKIRFFAHAYRVRSVDDFVPVMTDPSFRGDLLFVLPAQTVDARDSSVPWRSQHPLSANDSRQLPYEVLRFDANNLIVRVSDPLPTAAWLSYADIWHPSWHATVNGRPVPVYRANMAYKAVPLDAGNNLIHFRFGSTRFSIVSAILAVNAAFWLGAVGWLLAGVLRAPAPTQPAAVEASTPVLAALFGRFIAGSARPGRKRGWGGDP